MGATGRGIGSGLAVGTDVAPAFPPAAGLSTAPATRTLLPRRSCRAAAHLPLKPREVDTRRRSAIPGCPFLPRFAWQTTGCCATRPPGA